MRKEQQLVIVLPKCMADVPVKIVKDMESKELVVYIHSPEKEKVSTEIEKRQYAFIWRNEDYLFSPLDDIVWIEADGSYTNIHLTGNRIQKVSFNLAVIEKELPTSDFVRIHHSRIVNLKYVESMMGNSLRIDGKQLTIGREYKLGFFAHVIFLGVRRNRKKDTVTPNISGKF